MGEQNRIPLKLKMVQHILLMICGIENSSWVTLISKGHTTNIWYTSQ